MNFFIWQVFFWVPGLFFSRISHGNHRFYFKVFRYVQQFANVLLRGFFPIMHVVAFKDEVLKKYPDAAPIIYQTFEKAKTLCRNYWADPNWSWLVWGRQFFEEEQRLLGEDPWPYGLEKNRANLTRFVDYSLDQGLMAKKMAVDELFIPLN